MTWLWGNHGILYRSKTFDGRELVVLDTVEGREPVRLLLVDDVRESAVFKDEDKRYDLVFRYSWLFDEALVKNPEAGDVLLFGGAGFAFPRHFIKKYPKRKMDVVEIDPEMHKVAMKYFYLEELYEDEGLDADNRLGVFIMDANDYLKKYDKRYDIIFNDAFLGEELEASLVAGEKMALIRAHLKEGGIYAVNIISGFTGFRSYRKAALVATMGRSFRNVVVKRARTDVPETEVQNMVVFASDGEIKI